MRSRLGVAASTWLLVAAASCSSRSGTGADHDAGVDHGIDATAGGDSGAGGNHGSDAPSDAQDAAADTAPATDSSLDSVADATTDAAAQPLDGGPATPVAVQVPMTSAPNVAGWRSSCVASGTDGTETSNCWVVQWGRWTYWALSNVDNREAFLIIGVDAAGNLKSPGFERMGARYLWSATVDSVAMTVTYFGQGDGSVTISWADLDEEPPPAPEASEDAIEHAPTVTGWYASCVYTTSDFTLTNTCPVVKWGRWTYWALTSVNNDLSLYIIAVDTTGAANPGGGFQKAGTRYVWKVTVDGTAQTATFYGQAGGTADLTFDELRIDQP